MSRVKENKKMSAEKTWVTCKVKQPKPLSDVVVYANWCTTNKDTSNAPSCKHCAYGHKRPFASENDYCCSAEEDWNSTSGKGTPNATADVPSCSWRTDDTGDFANVQYTRRMEDGEFACKENEETEIGACLHCPKPKCMGINPNTCNIPFGKGFRNQYGNKNKSLIMDKDGGVSCEFDRNAFLINTDAGRLTIKQKIQRWKNNCMSQDPLNANVNGNDSIMFKYCGQRNIKVSQKTVTGYMKEAKISVKNFDGSNIQSLMDGRFRSNRGCHQPCLSPELSPRMPY